MIGIGLRPGIYGVKLLDNVMEYRSRSFDISASAELSKRSDVSVLLLGGPTVFYETLEMPALGLDESETSMGFVVGGSGVGPAPSTMSAPFLIECSLSRQRTRRDPLDLADIQPSASAV